MKLHFDRTGVRFAAPSTAYDLACLLEREATCFDAASERYKNKGQYLRREASKLRRFALADLKQEIARSKGATTPLDPIS